MSKLRISVVEYLNTGPLVWGFTRGPLAGRYDLRFAVPSECAEQLRRGDVDVGIIPVIEYQRMDGMVFLPGCSVAAKDNVRSILLIARKPIEQARRIALDISSRSSQALVRILCRDRWGIAPEFVAAQPDAAAMLADADAALIIGDPALRISVALEAGDTLPISSAQSLYVYDVAHEWHELTGLPCVLAAWVARREVVTPQVVADFIESKQYGVARIREIAEDAAPRLQMPAAALESYLRENIDYGLDDENLRGLELYFAKAAAAGVIDRAQPVEFARAAARA